MSKVQANKRVLRMAGGSHAEVARILGYSDRRNVWSWTRLLRPFPPYHCKTLVRKFPELTLQELRPDDWVKHWPELAETTESGA